MSLPESPCTLGQLIELLEQVRSVYGSDVECDTPPDDRNGCGTADHFAEVHTHAGRPYVSIDLDWDRIKR